MRSKELKEFILKHSDLFWYTPQDRKTEISDDAIVETILNYGDKEAFLELTKLFGIKRLAEIFYKSVNKSKRKKGNYSELTYNYFNHVFRKYAF
jgi:hypothetical protein